MELVGGVVVLGACALALVATSRRQTIRKGAQGGQTERFAPAASRFLFLLLFLLSPLTPTGIFAAA